MSIDKIQKKDILTSLCIIYFLKPYTLPGLLFVSLGAGKHFALYNVIIKILYFAVWMFLFHGIQSYPEKCTARFELIVK